MAPRRTCRLDTGEKLPTLRVETGSAVVRKGGRVVYGSCLENRRAPKGYRGFESLPFRQPSPARRGRRRTRSCWLRLGKPGHQLPQRFVAGPTLRQHYRIAKITGRGPATSSAFGAASGPAVLS